MRRLSIVAVVMLLCCGAFAQRNQHHSAVHLGFFPPLSTNGQQADQYTNNFSFHLLAGVSRNEKGFAMAGLANIVRRDAVGVQLAGLYNGIGRHGQGAAIAGLANKSGDYKGFQMAGLGNKAQKVNGMQIAGLGNAADRLTGSQMAGLANATRRMDGFQLAGLFNNALDVTGFQLAGLWNNSRKLTGFQFAGLFNNAQKTNGFQLAGVLNNARDVNGFQFAGLINSARRVHGFQFAGLMNIAEKNDYPLGLINIIGNGEMGFAAAYNEIGNITVTFRSGGRILYGILGAGYNHQAEKESFVLEGGFGAHIPVCHWFRINNELKGAYVGEFKDSETNHYSFAVLPAFRPARWVEIFGGPSINYLTSKLPEHDKLFPTHSLWDKQRDDKREQLHIGYQVGVNFMFKSQPEHRKYKVRRRY